ncbi:AAA family ATPase [Actinomadura sp. 9N215]|uniref:AAA family ATPase n=1 Tax=Actinomadura sp. 9N215 TaxID=3375150 RepID=UPI00379A5D18
MPDWWIYQGTGTPPPGGFDLASELPPPPPWRAFRGEPLQPPPPDDAEQLERRLGAPGSPSGIDEAEIDAVNAALYLRRPLLVLGRPGVGKSTLAYKISRELGLGRVLRWPIGSRSVLRAGLYDYDAIGRAQDVAWREGERRASAADRQERRTDAREPKGDSREPKGDSRGDAPASPDPASIGDYIRLGPLGTALLPHAAPRVLLVDELDKSDEDLPNDLLDVFEEGVFTVPELLRLAGRAPQVSVHTDDPERRATITRGRVECNAFPLVIITSNGEREFPPAFLRRCLRFELAEPSPERLADMIAGHLGRTDAQEARELLARFLEQRSVTRDMSGDQLLSAVYLVTSGRLPVDGSLDRVLELLWRTLGTSGPVPA